MLSACRDGLAFQHAVACRGVPMKCPVDDTTLAMSDRHGIEIDYCPSCRGVWLDRGELEKVIERETRWVEDTIADRDTSSARSEKRTPDEKPKKKKMTSFLQDLMEFGQQ
jgi:hypothetical protein